MTSTHLTLEEQASRQQLPATAPERNAWVEANAGTGKTKVLTQRIVRLLLNDVHPERILCLTFTKAAAAEMSNRLTADLGRWAFAEPEKLSKELATILERRPSEGATLAARRLFARVLDAPGGIAIQTIHAFCQSLLRRFPLEAGIAPNAVVLDEGQAGRLLARAMDSQLRALASADADPDLAAALATVGARISDREFVELMRGLLQERGRLKRMAAHEDGVGELRRQLCRTLAIAEDVDCDALLLAACRDDSLDIANLRRAASEMARSAKTDIDRAGPMASWLAASPEERTRGIASWRTVYFTEKGTLRARLASATALKRMADIIDVLQAEAERLARLERILRSARLVEATAAILQLGLDVLVRYEALKSAAAALDYDDLILRARRLLEGRGAAAWVLYKLDGGIDHVLIDEAQDTNPDQWEVARLLTTEFFAGQGSVERPRTVFAVGDAKQSIFSFQRADPLKLAEMRETFREQSENAGIDFRRTNLTYSFRSTEAVLAAVDLVFGAPPAAVGVGEPDARTRHLAIRAEQRGAVELWPIVSDSSDEEEAEDSYEPGSEAREATSAEERLAHAIVAHCRSLIGNEPNSRTGRPLTAGDIMILVRRRNALVPAMVRELKRAGIPVSGVDRLKLLEELAVRDLIAVAQFVLLPQDDLNLACLLKSPLVGLDEQALYDLAYGRTGTLWSALHVHSADARFAAVRARLDGWLTRADRVAPFELYCGVLGADGGRRDLLQRLGRESQDPIDEFLTLALRYQSREPPTLQGFLRWLEDGAGEIKRDLDQNRRPEVRILTVHASKGLQAPVVYLPDTVRVPDLKRDRILWQGEAAPPLWIPRADDANDLAKAIRDTAEQRGREEYHRLLYVAMTRAADRLYVCGATGIRKPDNGSWYLLVRDAFARAAADGDNADAAALRPQRFDYDSTVTAGLEHGWQGEGWRIAYGDALGAPAEAGAEKPIAAPLPEWARTMPPTEGDPPRPLAPSRLDSPEAAGTPHVFEPAALSPLGEQAPDRFKRGMLIHRLLQSLPDIALQMRRSAAERFLRQEGHQLDERTIDAWIDETLAVLEHPDASALFGEASRAEVPITGIVERHGSHFTVSGQIDRLAVLADQVLIADFKTNRPPPKRVEDVALLYRRQMALYRAVLSQLYPDRRLRCFLVWTDGPRVMELPAGMLDAAIDLQ